MVTILGAIVIILFVFFGLLLLHEFIRITGWKRGIKKDDDDDKNR